ncbi:tellurium resistance protein TerD-like [Yersinia phage vB_YenM_P778]
MTIQLSKGSSINLTKSVASLTKFVFGLSWDANSDLDAVAIITDSSGKILNPDEAHIAYYGNCTGNTFNAVANPVKGITHSGDARDGAAEGDDETISIDTTLVDARFEKIIIAVTSYSDGEPQPFCASVHPKAKLYDQNGKVLFEVALDESAAFSTCVELVELTKVNGEWSAKNVSNPLGSAPNGLADLLAAHK